MDNARKSNRMFPAYSTNQLKALVAQGRDAETAAKMQAEIERRESGQSKIFVVPQVTGGVKCPTI